MYFKILGCKNTKNNGVSNKLIGFSHYAKGTFPLKTKMIEDQFI